MSTSVGQTDLDAMIGRVLNRWPVAGLAVAVVRAGSHADFCSYGAADIGSGEPVGEQTVFRIASITKTITAVAVMQLHEQGLVDLDAPVDRYLRAYRLIPASPSFGPVTVRHLLTHTAGVRAVRTARDLVRPVLGWGVPAGQPLPALAEYYQPGLHYDTDPGTKWAYSNHGFATLGQVVEDVTGIRLDRYVLDHVFRPLGMNNSDLIRSCRVLPHLATGYQLRSRGLKAVADRENVPVGAGSAYSTGRDMARFAGALLNGGAGEHGRVLRPESVALMSGPHYQPDPRIPGMGLGLFLGEIGGNETIGHDGIWPGFHSAMLLVPGRELGVLAFANTGPFGPLAVTGPIASVVLRGLLDLPDDAVSTGVPQRPQGWGQLCGWYSLGPGLLTDPQPRMLGASIEVAVSGGGLALRGQIPVPAVRRGLRLHPDGADPDVFRIELPGYGSGTSKVVFSRGPGGEVTALHLGVQPLTFHKNRSGDERPRPWGRSTAAVRRRPGGS